MNIMNKKPPSVYNNFLILHTFSVLISAESNNGFARKQVLNWNWNHLVVCRERSMARPAHWKPALQMLYGMQVIPMGRDMGNHDSNQIKAENAY